MKIREHKISSNASLQRYNPHKNLLFLPYFQNYYYSESIILVNNRKGGNANARYSIGEEAVQCGAEKKTNGEAFT